MSRAISPAGALPRLDSHTLVDQAVEALRRSILENRFGADGALPSQGELGRRLGVSRSVIRESMRILQSQGLVEISQGRQPRVRPAGPQAVIESLGTFLRRTEASLLQLIEVRRPLEGEIAALAAERACREDLARLAESIERLRKARSRKEQVDADVSFHQLLAKATGNPIFELLLETLAHLLRKSRRRTISESGVEVPIAHHSQILRAIEARDQAEARRAMLHHLEMARGDLVKSGRGGKR